MLGAARAYPSSVNTYIKSEGRLGNVLDKHNDHRLPDLCVNKVPFFGHAIIVSKLILEMVHRVSRIGCRKTKIMIHTSHQLNLLWDVNVVLAFMHSTFIGTMVRKLEDKGPELDFKDSCLEGRFHRFSFHPGDRTNMQVF